MRHKWEWRDDDNGWGPKVERCVKCGLVRRRNHLEGRLVTWFTRGKKLVKGRDYGYVKVPPCDPGAMER